MNAVVFDKKRGCCNCDDTRTVWGLCLACAVRSIIARGDPVGANNLTPGRGLNYRSVILPEDEASPPMPIKSFEDRDDYL